MNHTNAATDAEAKKQWVVEPTLDTMTMLGYSAHPAAVPKKLGAEMARLTQPTGRFISQALCMPISKRRVFERIFPRRIFWSSNGTCSGF